MRVVNFMILAAMVMAIISAGCGKSDKVAPKSGQAQERRYTVLKEERTMDTIRASILVGPDITESEIIELLKEQCASYKQWYSSVIIWMFTSEEQYEFDDGLWLAMIIHREDGSPWEMTIEHNLLKSLREGPTEKFGLSEEARKKIYWSIACDEENAMAEAIKAYPYPDESSPGWTNSAAAEQSKRRNRHREKFWNQFKSEALQKYGLTREQLQEIIAEGSKDQKKWPVPPPGRLLELMNTCRISFQEANIVIDVCKVEGISIDGTGAAVFISHNKDFEPLKVGGRICGGEVAHIYAPKEPDGFTPENSALFYDYRVKIKFADGEKILKNGDYISGDPSSPSKPAQVSPAPVPAQTTASSGQSFYSKLCDEVAMAFEQADTWDSAFQNEEALKQYKDLLIRAKEAYATTNTMDKERMCKIIAQSERREREISKYLEMVRPIRGQFDSPEAISKWLRKNIHYEADRTGDDYWQAPYETLEKKSGDCEDYAFLAQALLSEISIQSQVVMVSYKKGIEKKGHAMCFFDRGAGYEYFSGSTLNKNRASAIEEIVKQKYSSWIEVLELDFRRKQRL